jgi:hypothetical protein
MLGISGPPVHGFSTPVVPTYDQEATDAVTSEESGNHNEAKDTPKLRKKWAKVQVREAIKARQEEWETPIVKVRHLSFDCAFCLFVC